MKKSTTLTLIFLFLTTVLSAQDWKLPADNFIPARMPMHLVYPQPDNVTQAHARHRWAHSDMLYQIPIGVQGGAWPFKYEIVSGPAGATIGEIYGSDDYGNISWRAPSSGTHTFEVKITDQQDNSVTATWNVQVDNSKFVFVQDGYTGNKVGTINEPLEDIEDWYKNDSDDDNYHNKIIVFRNGNYFVKGDPSASGNLRMEAGSKTPSLIAYPNETPVWDCSQAKIYIAPGDYTDIFVAGIEFINGRQDVNNAHFFWGTGNVSRGTWWRNSFKNLGRGLVGNDNPSPLFISNTVNPKYYILLRENMYDQINTGAGNGSYFDIYNARYVLVEGNTAKNSDTGYGWWLKRGDSFVTIRNNKAVENVFGNQIVIGYSGDTVPHDNEVCWNFIRANIGGSRSSFLWANSNAHQGSTYNSYFYRNSFIDGSVWFRFKGNEDYMVDGNLVVSDLLNRWDTSIMTETVSNITGSTSDGIVDNNGLLTGSYRTDYLGKRGHEIAGMGSLSIEDVENTFESEIKTYPNPFIEDFTVELGRDYNDISVTIHDVLGKTLQEKLFEQENELQLNFNATPGIYFVKINAEGKKIVLKLIKK